MTFWSRIVGQPILNVVVPLAIAVIVVVVALLIRSYLLRRLRRWAARTESRWDDVIIHETRLASILWCFWLGIYAGLHAAELPPFWSGDITLSIPVLFVALGIYSGVTLVEVGLDWYDEAVASKTKSSLDDMIVAALKWGIPLIAAFLGVVLILHMVGIEVGPVKNWLKQHSGRVILLLVISLGLILAATTAIPKFIRTAVTKSMAEQTEEELNKRADTLSSVLTTTVQLLVILVFLFMLLSEVGMNIAPVLAGVGVAGIAIGFGAQSLVKDFIAGLFILLENQYRKGDVVKIADTAGLVEDINLRRTVLRDMDGTVHVVPNGEIRVASNFTKQKSGVNMNIGVSYDTDLDRAIAVINRVGKELAEDPQWATVILTPPKALRVDKLGDSAIEIKIVGETKPIRQWDVMGELRLRLKKAFDQEGIEIPWPHMKVYFGNAPLSPWRGGFDPTAGRHEG